MNFCPVGYSTVRFGARECGPPEPLIRLSAMQARCSDRKSLEFSRDGRGEQ